MISFNNYTEASACVPEQRAPSLQLMNEKTWQTNNKQQIQQKKDSVHQSFHKTFDSRLSSSPPPPNPQKEIYTFVHKVNTEQSAHVPHLQS